MDEMIAYMVKTYPGFYPVNYKAVSSGGTGTSPSVRSVLERGVSNKKGKGQCCDEPQMQAHNWQYIYASNIQLAADEMKKWDKCQINARTGRGLKNLRRLYSLMVNDPPL
jgi:hypothetical protein